MGGGELEDAMWKRTETWSVNSWNGGLPVDISMTVQPTLHISACRPYPDWRITYDHVKNQNQ